MTSTDGGNEPVPTFGKARLRYAQRHQIEFRALALDDLLPENHQARAVWNFVSGLDLTTLEEKIRAVEGHAGRASTDPRILMSLWLYATLDGEGSAREIDRLCKEHLAYQWICGGVSLNYHTISDFRTAHVDFLDELLTETVATLLNEGLVTMERVAQDGMKVRASAGAASFRRKPTLEEHLADAEAQVKALREELEKDPSAGSKRKQAAKERAAREREERVKRALERMPDVEAAKKKKDRDKARVSTTDPEAPVMKMADGGFRPAFNVQLATDTESQVITGVEVTNSGSDFGKMAPMVEQHETRYEKTPDEALVDGGFAKKEDIEAVGDTTTVYAPVMESKKDDLDRHVPREDDTPHVAKWRQRMATDEAKEIYKERAATAECVNAIARNRGLQQFRVRGLRKAKAVILWYVIAHNMMRAVALRARREKRA
jgi:transposase